jgi:outer membrane protein TolC
LKVIVVFITAVLLMISADYANAAVRIDFQKAMEMAMERNHSLKLLQNEKKMADLQVKEAYSAALPVVNAVGSYSQYLKIPTQKSVINFGGAPVTMKIQMGMNHNYYGALTLDQPIWVAGKVGIGLKIAKIYREIAETGVAMGESDLKMQVTQAFYGAILAEEYYQLSLDTEKQLKSHLDNVNSMFGQGMTSEFDRLRAEVELANFRPQVLSADEMRKTSLEGLRIVLGIEPDTDIELAGNLISVEQKEADIENSVKTALENRPDMKQIGLRKGMLKQMLKLETRNQYWPNLFFNMEYVRQAQEKNLSYNDYFWSEGLSAGVSLQIPLFDGFKTSAKIQQAKVNLRSHELVTAQAVDGVVLEVKTACWKLDEALENLNAAKKAVEQAKKGYAIAEVRYSNGVSTQVELLDARLAETQAKIGELNARYDIIAAKAALDRALGN